MIRKIVFEDVNFSYNGETKVYKKELSFAMEAGTSYLISGKNGSGKSTIVGILTRIWDGYTGQIVIDGNDLKTYPRENMIKNIGVCFQKTPIFQDTIKNNITLGQELNVKKIVKLLNFEQDLQDMDRTIDSDLLNANNLSGGQSQKIGILRTLCGKHSVYIFDEPTSNLDIRSKEFFYELLHKLKKDSIVILFSHESVASNYVDEIVEL